MQTYEPMGTILIQSIIICNIYEYHVSYICILILVNTVSYIYVCTDTSKYYEPDICVLYTCDQWDMYVLTWVDAMYNICT